MVNNSLTKKTQVNTFGAFATSAVMKLRINEVVGAKDQQAFITAVVAAVTNNPALEKCEHSTIMAAAMIGASLKLSPAIQLGQFFMVPFKDGYNGRTVATFQIGYKGYIQLAIRSGYYKKINVLAIKEGELVKYDPMNEDIEVNLIDDDTQREAAETVGYYAMFEYLNGFRKTLYWSKAKMKKHAEKYSQAYQSDRKKNTNYSFWSKDFDGMGFKTMIRQLISKWGIMSVELQTALAADITGSAPEQEIPVEVVEAKEPKKEINVSASVFDKDPKEAKVNKDGSVVETQGTLIK